MELVIEIMSEKHEEQDGKELLVLKSPCNFSEYNH